MRSQLPLHCPHTLVFSRAHQGVGRTWLQVLGRSTDEEDSEAAKQLLSSFLRLGQVFSRAFPLIQAHVEAQGEDEEPRVSLAYTEFLLLVQFEH